ncbi:hypothetical protein R3P38DRAFT_3459751 [Favolaschia claudopus]|uniref:Uncharacterized protein n=1 Tax=Favolaschia claudopus TaxID=2862362 RepID=A0AAV9ZGU1_9AGAR
MPTFSAWWTLPALAFALFCLRMYRWRKLSSTKTYDGRELAKSETSVPSILATFINRSFTHYKSVNIDTLSSSKSSKYCWTLSGVLRKDDSDSPDDRERKRKRKGKQPMRHRKRPSGATSEPIDLCSDSESELRIRVTAGSKKRKGGIFVDELIYLDDAREVDDVPPTDRRGSGAPPSLLHDALFPPSSISWRIMAASSANANTVVSLLTTKPPYTCETLPL